jgi:hypothetical protein
VFNPEKKAAAITERGVFGSLSSQTSVAPITDTQAPVRDNGIDLWCKGRGVSVNQDGPRMRALQSKGQDPKRAGTVLCQGWDSPVVSSLGFYEPQEGSALLNTPLKAVAPA